MKRYLPLLLVPIVSLVLGVNIEALGSGTQTTTKSGRKTTKKTAVKKKAGDGKTSIKCPKAVTDADGSIADCPETGCGGSLDPNLNKQKNIIDDNDTPVDKDMSYLAELPDPVPGFHIGDTRQKLRALGEGKMIR